MSKMLVKAIPRESGKAKARRGGAIWLATAGGAGYLPVAPGTAGAAVGVLLVWLVQSLPFGWGWSSFAVACLAAVIFASGVWAAGRAEWFFDRTDPGHVVIDEVAGQMVALVASPNAGWKVLVAAFVLFRIFDVLKPFPARRAEHLPGGWGIMVDDLVAGAYSLVALLLVGRLVR